MTVGTEKLPAEVQEKVEAFIAGVEAAALALRDVLKRKIAVGIITEEVGAAIFESTGEVLDEAITEAFDKVEAATESHTELPL